MVVVLNAYRELFDDVRSFEHLCLLHLGLISDLPLGEYVAIEVTDTGCGMDKVTVERIFEPHHTGAEVEDLAVRAAKEGLSHLAFLQAFVEQEASYREQRRFERLLRESRLPREKTLAQLDLNWFGPVLAQQIERLQRGAFVAEAANVIAVGKPGTGKSHLAAAIGHQLIQAIFGGLMPQPT